MPDWTKADWVDPAYGWRPLPVSELPDRLLVDFATRCNLRCPMCPVWGLEDEAQIEPLKGIMSLAAAREMLDEFTSKKPMVAPSIYGEPLLIPNLREVLSAVKSRGMPLALNTNGLTLTESIARFFCDIEVDSVMFSIDATTKETLKKVRSVDKLEKIESAVFRLMKARGDREYPRIGVSFTIQDDNRHEADDFVARWVGVVDVVRMGIVFEDGRFQRWSSHRNGCRARSSTRRCRCTTTAVCASAALTAHAPPIWEMSSKKACRVCGMARPSPRHGIIMRPVNGTKCRSARTATAGRNMSTRRRFVTVC